MYGIAIHHTKDTNELRMKRFGVMICLLLSCAVTVFGELIGPEVVGVIGRQDSWIVRVEVLYIDGCYASLAVPSNIGVSIQLSKQDIDNLIQKLEKVDEWFNVAEKEKISSNKELFKISALLLGIQDIYLIGTFTSNNGVDAYCKIGIQYTDIGTEKLTTHSVNLDRKQCRDLIDILKQIDGKYNKYLQERDKRTKEKASAEAEKAKAEAEKAKAEAKKAEDISKGNDLLK